MKRKIIGIALSLALLTSLFAFAAPVLAVKPSGNLASAQKVPWNLSAAVMPVPPYGTPDIPGSDTASKLIVNQPNGNTEVVITGAMNGLDPNTEYTVYLSNGYTPYFFTGWNVAGSWVINVEYLGTDYPETLILTQDGTDITGVSLNTIPPNAGSAFTIIDGSISGDTIDIVADHDNSSLVVNMTGTILDDGSMSGTWSDEAPGTRSGTWSSTSGAAADHTGDDWWTGLFTSTVQPFTFTTDEFGAGSWHINLRDSDFGGPNTYELSVWINHGGTMLISDTFSVVVD
jgi:hypothetical protein